jgi:hypothetical protein
MLSLIEILQQFTGQSIPRCPGSCVLRGVSETVGPEIVYPGAPLTRHDVETARDIVVVSWLTDWGLIFYARANGTWRHTVNTPAGFRRKLADLRIPLPW